METPDSQPNNDTPKGRLLLAMPYIWAMVRCCEEKGTVKGALIAVNPDGKGGHVESSFDIKDFLNDVGAVIGYQPGDPKEDDLDWAAESLLSQLPNRGRG